MRTITLIVEGPVSVIGCTTKEKIYEDNANRAILIYLDGSKEQDERVMTYQKHLRANLIDTHTEKLLQEKLQNMQRILEPIKVVNPYAPIIYIPKEDFKPRRTLPLLLGFIEAITFYHQYQREQKADPQTGEIYIETTLKDIAAANQLMKEILLRKSDELTGACRNYLENIKAYLDHQGKTQFANREIRQALRVNESNQKRWTIALHNNHYLKRIKGTQNKGYQYEIVSYQEFRKLKEQIGNVLDETLETLRNAKHSPITGRKKQCYE